MTSRNRVKFGDRWAGLTPLLGRHISAAYRHRASGNLYLVTDKGVAELEAEGDCCANAYVAGVSIAYALRDATINAVEDIETTSDDGPFDVLDKWGHRITTDKGVCTLDCRTEHNGYYSGWLSVWWVGSVPSDAEPLDDFC